MASLRAIPAPRISAAAPNPAPADSAICATITPCADRARSPADDALDRIVNSCLRWAAASHGLGPGLLLRETATGLAADFDLLAPASSVWNPVSCTSSWSGSK